MLQYASVGIRDLSMNVFVGALIGVIFLLSVPMILLGCVSPFAIRLQARAVESAGNTAGAIYALSTIGSILGTFLPVLVLIPAIGTRNTFLLLSLVLTGASVLALALARERRAWFYAVLLLVVVILTVVQPRGAVRAAEGGELVYETESAYNYIQVVQSGENRYLVLNEGHAVHSIYSPSSLLTHGPWDYFLIAPYFNKDYNMSEVRRIALIGLAAGTVARQYTEVYGPIPIDGVEIDPAIVAVGRDYFGMTQPNLNAIVQDGRYFMRTSDQTYDVIGVDAYRQPYIPAQLTTREFFTEARDHLTERGVVMINAGRTETDFRLVNVLASTMKSVFPNVYIVDIPYQAGYTLRNSLIVATRQPTRLDYFAQNASRITNPILADVAYSAIAGGIREFATSDVIFTDDKAPVEQVIDQIILGYALGGQ